MAQAQVAPQKTEGEEKKQLYTTKVTCSCGATYEYQTTVPGPISVEVCAKCHPFFTGKQKIIDTENLVEAFEKRAKAAVKGYVSKKKRKQEKVEAQQKESSKPQKAPTLADMMALLKKGKK